MLVHAVSYMCEHDTGKDFNSQVRSVYASVNPDGTVNVRMTYIGECGRLQFMSQSVTPNMLTLGSSYFKRNQLIINASSV